MDSINVESLFGMSNLSLADRARLAVRDAQSEMTIYWVEAMRRVSSARKLENANALFLSARDALYFQERRKGLAEWPARLAAASRLLDSHGITG
jgi:hypothetical protein